MLVIILRGSSSYYRAFTDARAVTPTKIERAIANDENVGANYHQYRYDSPLANTSEKNSTPSGSKIPFSLST